jgi:large subunit ribosomal protein L4
MAKQSKNTAEQEMASESTKPVSKSKTIRSKTIQSPEQLAKETPKTIARTVNAEELGLTDEHTHEANPALFADSIRAFMQNARQGTVASKSRGEVAFSNKKPWKQKGTGRARAGSRRSPLWRKGGTIFGPQPRVRTLKVARQARSNALQALLRQGLDQGTIFELAWATNGDKPQTAAAYQALKAANLHDGKMILFVTRGDQQTQASFGNIPGVHMLLFDQPHAYALAAGQRWVFLAKDAQAFKRMVESWK